jgi:hypothetical protein
MPFGDGDPCCRFEFRHALGHHKFSVYAPRFKELLYLREMLSSAVSSRVTIYKYDGRELA